MIVALLLTLAFQDAHAFLDSGNKKYDAKNYDGAIADYSSAIELDPKMKEAYFNRALCRKMKDDYNALIADCTKAIELDPAYAIAYNERGWARYRKADYEGAASDFAQAIRIDPAKSSYYRARGLMRRHLDNFEGSIADFTKAIELEPTALLFADRAHTYWNSGKFDEADKDFAKSLELDPKNSRTYQGRGWCRVRQGRFADAIAEGDKAIECDPSSANSYNVRGYSKMLKGDLEGALADYDKYLTLKKDSVGFGTRGYIKARLGRFDESAKDLAQGIDVAGFEQGRWWSRYWSASLDALRAKTLQGEERRAANEKVLSMLEAAMKTKYINGDCMCHRLQKDHLREDADFAALRDDPRFGKLVEK